jgi:hypothetical protein
VVDTTYLVLTYLTMGIQALTLVIGLIVVGVTWRRLGKAAVFGVLGLVLLLLGTALPMVGWLLLMADPVRLLNIYMFASVANAVVYAAGQGCLIAAVVVGRSAS